MAPTARQPSLAVLLPVAAAVGAAAFGLSCLMQPAPAATWAMGVEYELMSADPLGCVGRFPHRIVGPGLAHVVGLGGPRYAIFGHAMVAVFLACVFVVAVRQRCTMLGAALLTGVVAATGAVEVFKSHVGYTEPISFSLLLVSTLVLHRPGWFWALQLIGLANHEETVFLWPWLLWLKRREAGLGRADVTFGALAVGAYLVLRWWSHRAAQHVLSFEYYWADQQLPAIAGLWVMLAVSIVVYMGVLPVLWAWHAWSDGFWRAGIGICLQVAAIFVMAMLATDVWRFATFLVLALVPAGIRLLQQPRGAVVLAALGVATGVAVVQQRETVAIVVQAMMRYDPEFWSRVVTHFVPEAWPMFAGYGLAIVVMVLAGRWWARRWPAVR